MALSDVQHRLQSDLAAGRPAVAVLPRGLTVRLLNLAGVCRVELERQWVPPGPQEIATWKRMVGGVVVRECADVEEAGHLRRWWFEVAGATEDQQMEA